MIIFVVFFWLLYLLVLLLIFGHHATQESFINVLLSLSQQLSLSMKQHRHMYITSRLFP